MGELCCAKSDGLTMKDEAFIRFNKISKCFPGVQALDGVNFEMRCGEVSDSALSMRVLEGDLWI